MSAREELRAAVQDALVGESFRFHLASDLEQGLERAKSKKCQLAVMDCDGLGSGEGVKELRAALPLTTPLVVVGAGDDAEMRRLCDEGVFHVLPDPLDAVQFQQVMRNAAEKASMVEENLNLRNELRRSKSLIMKDDLTSAYNRRYFDAFLEEEIERSKRFQSSLSLIFMDLDDLKQINSEHGHAMGSLALKEAAVRIIETVRSIDKVIRYGGDEFCVILPETDWRGAQEVAERIRQNFARAPFLLEKTGGTTLTASFGIASHPEHAGDKAEMIRKADEAMFRIKSRQKNGILVTSETS